MTPDELERLWRDPTHWHLFGTIYVCPADPRVLVRKRPHGIGWTLNFAHPKAVPLLVAVIALAGGPTLVLVAFGVTHVPTLIGAAVGSMLAVLALMAYKIANPLSKEDHS